MEDTKNYPLTFPCRCGQNTSTKYNWIHDKCSNQIVLYEDGDLECQNCSVKSFIAEWSFQCHLDTDFKSEGKLDNNLNQSILRFFNAMAAVASSLEKDGGSSDELQQMGLKIMNRWKKDGYEYPGEMTPDPQDDQTPDPQDDQTKQ